MGRKSGTCGSEWNRVVIRGRQQFKIGKYFFEQGKKKRIGTKDGILENNNGRLGDMERC